MTDRRALGTGPQAAQIRAAEADLLAGLPGVRLADLDELRTRGVIGTTTAAKPTARRALGAGGRTGEPDTSRCLAPSSCSGPGSRRFGVNAGVRAADHRLPFLSTSTSSCGRYLPKSSTATS